MEVSEDARRQLKVELGELSNKMIILEEELYESKTMQLELLDTIKFLESQVEELTARLAQASYGIYHAKKKDRIDEALGSYLNKFPERENLKIMFLRESEGVYFFGSKRVYIKIERGHQIMVRVGGGYIAIDDFIQQYTQLEADKIERSNVMDRFTSKMALQKIAVKKSQGARETSPIRSP